MREHAWPLIALAVLLAFPLVVAEPYYQHLMILVLIWVTIGTGWNLLAGYTGQVSFGAAAFFGVGAYAGGLLSNHWDISAWWGMLLGGPLSMLVALPFGWIAFPLRGAYFALGSLALGELMRHLATNFPSVTEGMVGILIIQTFLSKLPYYYMALALAVGSIVLVKLVIRSRLGYYFVSIREDQDAAASIGIDTTKYKMISLSLHALLTGTAGALYMNYMGFIDPHVVFSLHDISIMAILVGIVGGVGTVYGPAVGAFIMVAVQEIFRSGGFGMLESMSKSVGGSVIPTLTKYITQAHVLAFGVLVVVVIMVLPNGLTGDWRKISRLFKRGQA